MVINETVKPTSHLTINFNKNRIQNKLNAYSGQFSLIVNVTISLLKHIKVNFN